jgi:ribosomal protein S15P/S13E
LATCFAKLTTTRSDQTSANSIGMEEAQGNYNQQDEIRGVYVHFGIERNNSNENGEEKNENMNMVETINNLQKDVQSHKSDNESIMRDKEQ